MNKRLRHVTGACSMVVLQQPVAALCGDARPTVVCLFVVRIKSKR
jgi:hypothetical protein